MPSRPPSRPNQPLPPGGPGVVRGNDRPSRLRGPQGRHPAQKGAGGGVAHLQGGAVFGVDPATTKQGLLAQEIGSCQLQHGMSSSKRGEQAAAGEEGAHAIGKPRRIEFRILITDPHSRLVQGDQGRQVGGGGHQHEVGGHGL